MKTIGSQKNVLVKGNLEIQCSSYFVPKTNHKYIASYNSANITNPLH